MIQSSRFQISHFTGCTQTRERSPLCMYLRAGVCVPSACDFSAFAVCNSRAAMPFAPSYTTHHASVLGCKELDGGRVGGGFSRMRARDPLRQYTCVMLRECGRVVWCDSLCVHLEVRLSLGPYSASLSRLCLSLGPYSASLSRLCLSLGRLCLSLGPSFASLSRLCRVNLITKRKSG